MKLTLTFLNWLTGLLFFVLFILVIVSEHYLSSVFILIITILFIPPLRQYFSQKTGIPLPVWLRTVLIPSFFIFSIFLIFRGMGNSASIYKNPEIEKKLLAIYDLRMNQWPVPYESRFIQTGYGKVHVIISGPEAGPPLLLLHASAMASWSWLYNIKGLNEHFRSYAIDTIGDAGKSVLDDIGIFPHNARDLSGLYEEIMDSLGVSEACFIGASQGGFISTCMALHAPERVSRLILCGPMGFTGTTSSVFRILFTTMFPVEPVQRSAIRWAFGDDPRVNDAVGEWFGLILNGVISRQARPKSFTPEQLRRLQMPVLLLLGKRDGLVGNPDQARKLAGNISNIQIEVLDTGHLISAEEPDRFNKLVTEFIESTAFSSR